MAGERVKLQVSERERRGSREARRLRKAGFIPGVLYGKGKRLLRHRRAGARPPLGLTGQGGLHAILDVVVEGQEHHARLDSQGLPAGSDPRPHLAHRPAGSAARPADPGERAPSSLIGEAAGREGRAACSQVQREINVEACRWRFPEHIDLDVSGMAIGALAPAPTVPPMEGVTVPRRSRGAPCSRVSPRRRAKSSRSPRKVSRARSCRGRGAEGEEAPEGAAEGEGARAATPARASRASPAPPRVSGP